MNHLPPDSPQFLVSPSLCLAENGLVHDEFFFGMGYKGTVLGYEETVPRLCYLY